MSNAYNPQQLATVLGVPTNVANAAQEVDRTDYAKVSSSSSSNADMGSEAYDPKLSGSVPWPKVVELMRNKNNLNHWLNYFLSMKFKDRSRYLDYLIENTEMTCNEFYGIANRNYQILTPDAKLNLAKLDKAGLKNIVNSKMRLSARQWVSQLESDEYILSSILKNKGKFNEFFGRLTHENQFNLRSALLQRSCESAQKFEEFLFLFNDLTSDEYDSINGSAVFSDFRVSNKAAESPDEMISFLNSLPKNNRVSILFSRSFQGYNRSLNGIVDLVLNKDFKTSDFDARDFLEIVKLINSFRVVVAAKSQLLNSLVNKFALTLIGSYEQTLMIAASPEVESLYERNELFQMVIQQCTLKKQFVANSQLDRPLAVDLQEDLEIKPAGNSDTGVLKFEPPSYEQLIVAAKELESNSIYLAIQTYCQAMGLVNQNINPEILDRALTLACSNKVARTYPRLISLFEVHFQQELENFHHLPLDSQVEKLSDISRRNRNYHSLCVKADGSRAFNLPISIYENLVECTHRLKIAASIPLAPTQNLDKIRLAWESLLLTVPIEDPRHLEIMRWIAYSKVDSADSSQSSLDEFDQNIFDSNQQRVSVALTKIHIALEQDANANLDGFFKFNNGVSPSRWNCFYSNLQEDKGVKSQIKMALQRGIGIDILSEQVYPFEFTEDHVYQMKNQLGREPRPSNCGDYVRIGVGLGLFLGSLAVLSSFAAAGSLATFGAPAIIAISLGALAIGVGGHLMKTGYRSLKPARNQDRYNRLRDGSNASINGDERGHYQNPSAPPMATAVGSETPYRSYSDLEAGGGAKGMALSY